MPLAIYRDKVCLYIHVPKTGGSSVEAHLRQHGRIFLHSHGPAELMRTTGQHLHSTDLKAIFRAEDLDYVFMTVRHPIDRMVSEYRWRERHVPFSVWLRIVRLETWRKPHYRDNHFRPQRDFECLGAEVFRLEDGLAPCFASLQQRIGMPMPATEPVANLSSTNAVKPTKSDIAFIVKWYASDFDRFDYRVDDASCLS
jgi:hypothetical protein